MGYSNFSPTKPNCNWIKEVVENTNELTTINTNVLMPNKKFPIRLVGNTDVIEDDDDWAGRIEAAVNPRENIFIYSEYSAPYIDYQASLLAGQDVTVKKVEFSYEYNRHLPGYQYRASQLSERLLPDINALTNLSTYDLEGEDIELFDSALLEVVTFGGTYIDINNLFTLNHDALRSDLEVSHAERLELLTNSKTAYDYSFLCTTYLTSAFAQSSVLSSSFAVADDKYKNILFDYDIIEELYISGDIERHKDYFPYYVKISIPLDDTGDFYDAIKENDYSAKFINNLSLAFRSRLRGVPKEDLTVKQVAEMYDVPSMAASQFVNDASRIDTSYGSYDYSFDSTIATIDYAKFLVQSRNSMPRPTPSSICMGPTNAHRPMEDNNNNGYSYLNSISSNNMISKLVAHVSSSSNFNVSSIEDIYSNNSSENETLAYRIAKSGKEGHIQNYWIMNYSMDDYNFYDTQVKYGESYTYEVYAYKLMQGFRYSYSDIRVSKQLGCEEDGRYGLEFQAGGIAVDQLLDPSGGKAQDLNEYVTIAQLISVYPYLADMYVSCEPFLSICEIPVAQKNITITDNWPAKAHAKAYHILDQSQTIGFKIYSGDHISTTYGAVLSTEEEQARAKYLFSKNILNSEKVGHETVSTQDYVQVFRLSQKPTALSDFSDALVATLNLKSENEERSEYPYKTTFYENIIKTNKKYYYLFRTVNELGVIGHLSEVYQVELVDDGGYVYSVFKVLKESDLPEKVELQTSVPVKKLLQFIPTMQHTEIDYESFDTSLEAGSQIEQMSIGYASDPIWDKTFKIRLISKKTGKKLDLNITYKLESEY
jgi:hypothetical protein